MIAPSAPGAQRISLVLAADAKRLFVVYFIARENSWNRFLSAFDGAAGSMSLTGAASRNARPILVRERLLLLPDRAR